MALHAESLADACKVFWRLAKAKRKKLSQFAVVHKGLGDHNLRAFLLPESAVSLVRSALVAFVAFVMVVYYMDWLSSNVVSFWLRSMRS